MPHRGKIGASFGIAAGPDGALWFTNIGKGTIGRITTAGKVTSFTASGSPNQITARSAGAVWFTDKDDGLIGRMTTAGKMTTFTGPGLQPEGITPDGAPWFANSLDSSVVTVTRVLRQREGTHGQPGIETVKKSRDSLVGPR